MEEEEDDLYGTSAGASGHAAQANGNTTKAVDGDEDEDLEEGEEEESDSESDIEIVTERADLAEPTTSSRYPKTADAPRDAPSKEPPSHQSSAPKQTTTIRITADTQSQPQATTKPVLFPGDKYPAIRTSTIDLDHVPLWNGKPVTEIDLDADIAEQLKPWRRPGADQSDYFNYGFDEFTWATYCMKQSQMAGVLNQQKEENKMFEQMMGGMAGGGMPAMPGMPTGPAQQQQSVGMGGMPGEQEMQAMFMQAMAAQGVNDPSQVDVGAMMAQFAGGAGGMPGGGLPQGVPTGPGGAPTGPGGGQQWQGQQQAYQQQAGGRGGRGRRGQW